MFGSDAKRGETMAGVMGWYFAWQVVKLFLVDGMILAAALVSVQDLVPNRQTQT